MYDAGAREHALFSPSRVKRLQACPGSYKLCASGVPLPPTKYALEGTHADAVLMHALENGLWNAGDAFLGVPVPDTFEDNEFQTKFLFSIQVALDYIKGILESEPDCVLHVQLKVSPPSLAAPGETYGYFDVAIWSPLVGRLYIIDYKHGAGVVVEVEENAQELQYGSGALYGDAPVVNPSEVGEVVLVVIQPRAFHKDGPVREWSTTPARCFEFSEEFDETIRIAQSDAAHLEAGEQCRFCDARFRCPKRESTALSAVSDTFSVIENIQDPNMPIVDAMDLDRLAHVYARLPLLKDYISGVEERCAELARKGVYVPGTKLVAPKQRRRYFHDEEETLSQLEALTGRTRDQLMKRSVMPLTYAEELVVANYRAGKRGTAGREAARQAKEAFAMLTIKDSVGLPVLAPLDDPRPALNRAEVFKQIKTTIAPPTKG